MESRQQTTTDLSVGSSRYSTEGSSYSTDSEDLCIVTIHSDGTASDSSSQQPTPPSGSPFLTQNSPVGSEASPPGGTSGAPGTHLTWPVVRTEPVETLPACREKLNLPHLDPRSSAQNTSTPRSNALSLQYGHFPPVRDWSCLPGRPQLPMSPQFLPASELHSPTLMGSFATSAMSTSSPPGYMVPPRHFSTPYMLTTPPAGNSGYLPRVPVPITSVGCSPYANMTARSPPQYSYTPSLTSVSHLSVSSPVTTVPHPMICNLQSALRNEFEKQQKSSPGQVPVSVRVGILQLRFMTLLPRFGSTIEELQNVYKLQSATIESERYRSLSAVIGSPSLAESVNSHFDQQHHSLMDRVEASLGLLESRKTKKSSCPAVPTGISIATEETVRSRERSRFMPLNPLAVRVMSKWYDNNKEHPYPSYGTCEVLAKAGGITVEQVKKWFANRRMRSRNTKPLSEIAKRRYRNRSKSQNADSILVNTDRGRDV